MEAREQEGNKGGFHCFHFTFMGEEDMAHSMFKMKCKFKFEIHFLCMDSLFRDNGDTIGAITIV